MKEKTTKKAVKKVVKSKSVERRTKMMKSVTKKADKKPRIILNNVDIKRINDYIKKINKIGNGVVLIGIDNGNSIDGLLIRSGMSPSALLHLSMKLISPND